MRMTRSQFLATLGAGVALIVTKTGPALAGGLVVQASNLESDRFASAVGTTFSAIDGFGRSVDLVLDRVTKVKSEATSDQFSLMFHAPHGGVLPELKYHFKSSKLPDFYAFITPSGYNDQHMQSFRADFNILVAPAEVVRKR